MLNRTTKSAAHETAEIYCPMCTHIVSGKVTHQGRRTIAVPGQKCDHCHGSLDAGFVMRYPKAA